MTGVPVCGPINKSKGRQNIAPVREKIGKYFSVSLKRFSARREYIAHKKDENTATVTPTPGYTPKVLTVIHIPRIKKKTAMHFLIEMDLVRNRRKTMCRFVRSVASPGGKSLKEIVVVNICTARMKPQRLPRMKCDKDVGTGAPV